MSSTREVKEGEVIQTVILIGFGADKKMLIEGPLENKVACYGLLHQAMLEVQAYEAPTVEVVSALPPPPERKPFIPRMV